MIIEKEVKKQISSKEINCKVEIRTSYIIIKRFIDVVLSSMGIVILFPVFIIISIFIMRDSKGPIFFKHKRLGIGKKDFYMIKFRTMVDNADEIFEALSDDDKKSYYKNFKLENDPRITIVGKFLRETSLDELPQLINILKGEMSLVGPRPIVREEVIKYGNKEQKFFLVKPGLTGLWQVNGRSDTTYEERVEMDMRYIEECSLKNDFIIMIKTLSAVLRKKGAM